MSTLLAPKNVVFRVEVVWAVALRSIIEMIKNGEKGDKIFTLNLTNGGFKIILNDEALVSKSKTIEDIIKGNIEVKVEKLRKIKSAHTEL